MNPKLTLETSSVLPTADPRQLFYVVATVLGLLALWVLYTLATAETRKPPPSSPSSGAKTGDEAAK